MGIGKARGVAIGIAAIGSVGQALLLFREPVFTYSYQMMAHPWPEFYAGIAYVGVVVSPAVAVSVSLWLSKRSVSLAPAVACLLCPVVFVFVFFAAHWLLGVDMGDSRNSYHSTPDALLDAFAYGARVLLLTGVAVGTWCGVVVSLVRSTRWLVGLAAASLLVGLVVINPDVTYHRQRALEEAARAGDVFRVRVLLWLGGDIDDTATGYAHTPLAAAAEGGQKEMIQFLLGQGADVDTGYKFHTTPLMVATFGGYVDTMRLLIENGADVNAREEFEGYSALTIAAEVRNPEAIELLLEYGADVNAGSNSNVTPLMVATQCGYVDTMRLLIENGADVNAREENHGYSVLMMAAEGGNLDAIELLLECGADPTARATSGLPVTAHGVAGLAHHDDAAALLRAAYFQRVR